jgi:hypothetical protein
MTLLKQTPNASINLPEREWNFADCPPDEIYDCWLYEFAREIDWLRNIVELRRMPITLGNGKQVQVDTLTAFARNTFYSFLLRPDWPARPYLSASPEERHKWIRWTRLETEQEIHAQFLIPNIVPKTVHEQLADSLQNLGRARIRSEDNRLELALLRIDWAMPDSLLVRAFESYLREFRPMNPDFPTPHTGKRDPDSTRLRQLEKLGRFRVLRANGQSLQRARETGYLAGSHDSWYRALRAVEALLNNAETLIVPRLSRIELENVRSLNTPSKSEGK